MRETDIRPKDVFAEYLRLSALDAAAYFPDPSTLEARVCPGCGGADVDTEFEKNGFMFGRCSTCQTLYTRTVPDDDAIGAFYSDSPSQRYWAEVFFPAVSEVRREKIMRPRIERIKDIMDRELAGLPETVIDVGAGTGLFLDECRAAGLGTRHIAVEPNVTMAAQCTGLGHEVVATTASEAARLPEYAGTGDLVTCFELIEHLVSPQELVESLAGLVRPGGYLLLTGLCGTGFDILVLGEKSQAVSPPHHLTFLSRQGMETACRSAGLILDKFETPGKLDVDIVLNALADDTALQGTVAETPFLKHLLSEASDEARQSFQGFLAEQGLSSHMWAWMRRPVLGEPK